MISKEKKDYRLAFNTVSNETYVPYLNKDIFKYVDSVFTDYIHDKYKSSKYFAFLMEYVKINKPKTIVELGAREGVSFLTMYAGLTEPDQKLYTVDIVDDWRFVPSEIWNDSRVIKLIGNDLESNIVDQLPDNIDLLFCDTIHTSDQLSKEWEIYSKKLNKDGALVLVDDISLEDKINAFSNIDIKFKLNERTLHSSGFGVIIVEKDELV